MATMFLEPAGKFYEAPAAIAARKKKGREPQPPSNATCPAISKNSSKCLNIGEKSKENRLSNYPLLAALANPESDPALIQDLDI